MTKHTSLIICLWLCILPVVAQDWERVKANPENLWGEGWGVTVNDADNNALNDLISKISVQVSGNTKQHDSEEVTNEGVDTHTSFQSVINTYSQATLTNTERFIDITRLLFYGEFFDFSHNLLQDHQSIGSICLAITIYITQGELFFGNRNAYFFPYFS